MKTYAGSGRRDVHNILRAAVAGLMLAVGSISVVWAQTNVPVSAPITPDYNYILGPSDVIHVEVLNHPDFNVKTSVGADGTVQLPYLGTVTVANDTVSALRDRLTTMLKQKGIFSNVALSVEVVSFGSRYVTVLGGVGAPGLVPVDRAYHLSEILARVGGVKAGISDYVILTSKDGKARRVTIEDLATGDSSLDPYVTPGDKIYVPANVYYVQGQVKAPGTYPVTLHMTLAMALARGGGITDLGSTRNIKITRDNKEIDPPDLTFKVEPNDVIDVGESWF